MTREAALVGGLFSLELTARTWCSAAGNCGISRRRPLWFSDFKPLTWPITIERLQELAVCILPLCRWQFGWQKRRGKGLCARRFAAEAIRRNSNRVAV